MSALEDLAAARAAVADAEAAQSTALEEVNRLYRINGSTKIEGYWEADAVFRAACEATATAEEAEHQALLRSLAGAVIAKIEKFDAEDRTLHLYEQEFYRVELADGRVLEFHGNGYDEWTCEMREIDG